MKENLKNEKGITLIALVITIIVLLILAIVTIRIVVNQNIINHANNAVTAYNEAQKNEAEQLTWVEELMKNKGGSSSTDSNSGSSSQGSDNNNYSKTATITIGQLYAMDEDGFSDGTLNVTINQICTALGVTREELKESFGTAEGTPNIAGKVGCSNSNFHYYLDDFTFAEGYNYFFMVNESNFENEDGDTVFGVYYSVNGSMIPLDHQNSENDAISEAAFISQYGDAVLTFYFK